MVGRLGQPAGVTRYERLLAESSASNDLSARLCAASQQARSVIRPVVEHEEVIRDVAAGVAAPALVGSVMWMLREAQARGLARLRFLSRDGQVLFALARHLAPHLDVGLGLEYVYSSRLTWSLAATNPERLAGAPWLLNSFIKSSAADVCVRLGLPFEDFRPALLAAGASLDPERRADHAGQATALRRFLTDPKVIAPAAGRIELIRQLVVDYARQHQLADPGTGLVDAGWTGRMTGALVQVCEQAGMRRPHILFWGHEPRATGWTDPRHVAAFMYNTATGQGMRWRVPDAPFAVETFCMGDHGIVTGYTRSPTGTVEPVLASPVNAPAQAWGLPLYRQTLDAFCSALTSAGPIPHTDARPAIWQVMDAFWCHPTQVEANVWGKYPYDSDPAGTATRPLARPLAIEHGHCTRGDRAWLAGSLALTSEPARTTFLHQAAQADLLGNPAND